MYRVVYIYLKQDTFMHGVCLHLTEITYRRFIESSTSYGLPARSVVLRHQHSLFDVVQRQ